MAEKKVTVADAIRRYDARKSAAGIDSSSITEEDVARVVLSGFDLDFEELLDLRPMLAAAPLEAIVRGGVDPVHVIIGTWIDGLITGLMLADLKAGK